MHFTFLYKKIYNELNGGNKWEELKEIQKV